MQLPETFESKDQPFLPDLLGRVNSESSTSVDKFQESMTLDLVTHPDASSVQYMMGKLQFNIKGSAKMA